MNKAFFINLFMVKILLRYYTFPNSSTVFCWIIHFRWPVFWRCNFPIFCIDHSTYLFLLFYFTIQFRTSEGVDWAVQVELVGKRAKIQQIIMANICMLHCLSYSLFSFISMADCRAQLPQLEHEIAQVRSASPNSCPWVWTFSCMDLY